MSRRLHAIASAALLLAPSASFARALPTFPQVAPAAQCANIRSSAGGPSNAETRAIETRLLPALTGTASKPATLAAQMKARKVPGISVAVFSGGKIAWARGWGVRDAGTCQPVTPQTMFQAASISKTLAGLLAMRQVEQGKLFLDRDINLSLRRWQLPRDEKFAPGFATLRQLLNHTGGTTVSGFSGYAPDGAIPTLIETLDGTGPANHPPVRLEDVPGARWNYSGGGFTIVEAAIEDASGRDFADLAQRDLFNLLGMRRSRFAQPLTGPFLADSATGHAGAQPFKLKSYVYPELAAAGLWTTAGDLARLLIDVQAAASGKKGHVVSPQTATAMLTPGANDWGLGYALWNVAGARRFGHFGGNFGFVSQMWSFTEKGEGIVILTNGEGGIALGEEIIRAVATRRGWTEFASRPLVTAIEAQPIFVRGSMNDWSATAPLARTAAGLYVADLVLAAGKSEFKIGSADWSGFVLGGASLMPVSAGSADVLLSSTGGNVALDVAKAGTYRFTLRADASGAATVSITEVKPL
jgi:CubicO group peptidase (beta-lactamase class C family)